MQNLWQDIENLYAEFKSLNIAESVDYEKYYIYSLITHSTAIEGSTLSEKDTQLLFDEGIVAEGKPLLHHLMNEDLRSAYIFANVEFPTKVYNEDRAEYIDALSKSHEEDSDTFFLDFMSHQLYKSLSIEIDRYKKSQKKNFVFMF